MKKTNRKGQITQFVIIIMAAAIALLLVITVLQSKNFNYKIYNEEINVLETRDGMFMAEKGMDASWDFASIQTLLKSGDAGLGVPLWYNLDNSKAIDNQQQNELTSALVDTDTGLKPNPDLAVKNPLIYQPSSDGFSKFFQAILYNKYLPKASLDYYLKGTRAIIANVKPKSVALEDNDVKAVISQDIVTAGQNIKFMETAHESTSVISTKMKTILENARDFAYISKDLVAKTAMFTTNCDLCLKPHETKTALDVQREAKTFLENEKTAFVNNNKNDDVEPECTILEPVISTATDDDKFVGDQGGLELLFNTSLVMIDKKNIHPFDTTNPEFNVYDVTTKYGQIINQQTGVDSSKDVFKLRPVALQLKTGGYPVILDCTKNNDNKFAYLQKDDLLCMNDKIWSCNTDINGLKPTNKKINRNDINYNLYGVYRCIVLSGGNQWCKQGTDTRMDAYCCNNWQSGAVFQPGGSIYCVKDGSCDNGQKNIDNEAIDRGERCSYGNGIINPDCPCANGCCDPKNIRADPALGCVSPGVIKYGTECSICQGPGFIDDNSKCSPQNCFYWGYDVFGSYTLQPGTQEQICSNGQCVPTGFCH